MRSVYFRIFLITVFTSCAHGPSYRDTASRLSASDSSLDCNPSTIKLDKSSLLTPVQSPGVGFLTDVIPHQGEGDYSSNYLFKNLQDHLGRMYIRLDPWKEGADLSPDFLNHLNDNLSKVRKDGIKVVLRFAYNYPCQPLTVSEVAGKFNPAHSVCLQDQNKSYPWNDPAFNDASLETILKHISQLGPVLTENSDVIISVSGFIGQWGEQHDSTHGLTFFKPGPMSDAVASAQAQVQQALLNAFPGNIEMRNPWARKQIFAVETPNHLSENNQARVGLNNDCFLANEQDAGTYLGNDPQFIQLQKKYVSDVTSDALMGGETCHYNPPRSQCATALQELSQHHYSFLTDGFPQSIFDSWKAQAATDNPQGPCYEEIKQRLGYRFSLKQVSMNLNSSPGGLLHIEAIVSNFGFAKINNQRPIYGVIRCDDWTSSYLPLANVDAHSWNPGQDTHFASDIKIPKETPEKTCSFYLVLPDGCSSDTKDPLQNQNCKQTKLDPRYNIQFANENMWEASTGMNVITQNLQISLRNSCRLNTIN